MPLKKLFACWADHDQEERERAFLGKGRMPLKKLSVRGADHDQEERKKKRETTFLENGGLVLEALVASCNGRPIPIRTFSYEEIISATNNFDPQFLLSEESSYKFYKGSLEGRSVSIKIYSDVFEWVKDEALTDLAISAKMSAHKNVLKPVGCCLETPTPTLVFEYAQNQFLRDRIYVTEERGSPMWWQDRLKIARQIAHVIAYLHTAFSRPIIHRNIKTTNIFIDQHGVPKLPDFSLSLPIPEGETHIETSVMGTYGFACPSYVATGNVTEKADVYGFGVVLLEFLTGKHAIPKRAEDNRVELVDYSKNRAMNEILDPAILAEEGAEVQQQLEAALQLALICIVEDPEKRPTMVDVTKELRRIERSIT